MPCHLRQSGARHVTPCPHLLWVTLILCCCVPVTADPLLAGRKGVEHPDPSHAHPSCHAAALRCTHTPLHRAHKCAEGGLRPCGPVGDWFGVPQLSRCRCSFMHASAASRMHRQQQQLLRGAAYTRARMQAGGGQQPPHAGRGKRIIEQLQQMVACMHGTCDEPSMIHDQ